MAAAALAIAWQTAALPAASQSAAPAADRAGAQPTAKRSLRYVPPAAGAPRTLVAAASRTGGDASPPAVLAPQHTGLTMMASPTLFWFIATSPTAPVEVSLIEESDAAVEPLLELALPAGLPAGLHDVDLGRHGIALQPGVEYRWTVRVITDPGRPSSDLLASGTIRRVASAGGAPSTGGPSADRAAILAEQGLWYDALLEISRVAEGRPSDREARLLRAELLAQEGHQAAAEWDRRR